MTLGTLEEALPSADDNIGTIAENPKTNFSEVLYLMKKEGIKIKSICPYSVINDLDYCGSQFYNNPVSYVDNCCKNWRSCTGYGLLKRFHK